MGAKIKLILLAFLLVFLTACSTCVDVQEKYYVDAPITASAVKTVSESYYYQEPVFEEECSTAIESEFVQGIDYDVRLEDPVWLYSPQVVGEDNQLKQTAYLVNYNPEDTLFFIDVVRIKDGKEVDRFKRSAKHTVAANNEKRFFLTWNTEYDSSKRVTGCLVFFLR